MGEYDGHLTGSLHQTFDEASDIHAFLFDQLGLGYPPRPASARPDLEP